MSRYIGPKCRVCRREGEKLYLKGEKCFTAKCPVANRTGVPGQHATRKGRSGDFSKQLREKQKIRKSYEIGEIQFKKIYTEAERLKGATGSNLLKLLESRLDNVVYRMGFGASRSEARQIVRHKSIMVNGRTVNIPSYVLKAGDVVSIREKSNQQLRIKSALSAAEERGFPEWLDVDVKELIGTFKSVPERTALPTNFDEQLVVELYSK